MRYQKGEKVQSFSIWKQLPLFLVEDDEIAVLQNLPRYHDTVETTEEEQNHNENSNHTATTPNRLQLKKQKDCATLFSSSQKALVQKMLAAQIVSNDVLVACLQLVLRNEHQDVLEEGLIKDETDIVETSENDHDIEDYSQDADGRRVWCLLERDHPRGGGIRYDTWKRLICCVSRRILWVESPHPIAEYATHQIPHLSESERQQVARVWQRLLRRKSSVHDRNVPSSSSSSSSISSSDRPRALQLMKQFQDRFPPRRFGVLLHEDIETKYPHSCFPTAQLDMVVLDFLNGSNSNINNNQQLQVVALYDSPKNDDENDPLSLCYINGDDPVEQREEAVLRRTGHSCACLRCRYEVQQGPAVANNHDSTTSDGGVTLIPWLSSKQRIQLANYYLSKSRLEEAKNLYHQVVREEDYTIHPRHHADAWHALGAIELSKGRFLAAQRLWSAAAERFPQYCGRTSDHKGMTLQLEKLHCYHYLEPSPSAPSSLVDAVMQWESQCIVSPNLAHIATTTSARSMLTPAMCQQIQNWASTLGKWTQQRHYAVPTFDVPVHTVEPLLKWFNSWFHQEMRPLLAHQFGTSTNFYVHDAFCVKYLAASSTSNHLPIHTDESTHSFVVALNDCDDYEGGGTYFVNNNDGQTVKLKVGQILSFRGDSLPHGGEAVLKNARHILVAFLYHDDDDNDDVNNIKNTSNTGRRNKKRLRNETITGRLLGSDGNSANHMQPKTTTTTASTTTTTGFSFDFKI